MKQRIKQIANCKHRLLVIVKYDRIIGQINFASHATIDNICEKKGLDPE